MFGPVVISKEAGPCSGGNDEGVVGELGSGLEEDLVAF